MSFEDEDGKPNHLSPTCEGIAQACCLGDALHLIVMDKMIQKGLKPHIIKRKNDIERVSRKKSNATP